MSEPFELTLRGGDKVVAYCCGTCHTVVAPTSADPATDAANRERAARCCDRRCDKCDGKLPPDRRYYTTCAACDAAKHEAFERATYEKAKKLTEEEWRADQSLATWVNDPCRDRFHESLEDLREDYLDGADWDEVNGAPGFPEYVEACCVVRFGLDAGQILERELESQEAPDEVAEAGPSDAAINELQAFLDSWAAKYPTQWYTTCGTLVLLDEVENERAVAEWRHGRASMADVAQLAAPGATP